MGGLVEEIWGLEITGSGKVENFLSKFWGLWVSSDKKFCRGSRINKLLRGFELL